MIRYDVKQAVEIIKKEKLSPLHAYAYQHVLATLTKEGYVLEDETALKVLKSLFQRIEAGGFLYQLSPEEYIACQEIFKYFEQSANLPLVMVDDALYLRRYWRLEQSVMMAIRQSLLPRVRQAKVLAVSQEQQQGLLNAWQARENQGKQPDDLMSLELLHAGKVILASDFLILSGGPGSGKTYSLARLLFLINTLAREQGQQLNVLISAPTAKAVARMHESIGSLSSFNQLTFHLHTLHKGLGARPSGGYRYTQENNWQYDMVIIDEASMMDAFLFRQVLLAMPKACKLVLVGDVDQLPSVATGAILDELTNEFARGVLGDNTIFLKGSRRSNNQILGLAKAFLNRDKALVLDFYAKSESLESVNFAGLPTQEAKTFYAWVVQHYNEIEVVGSKDFEEYVPGDGLTAYQLQVLEQLFRRYESFVVISPTHNGAHGVAAVNAQVGMLLGQKMRHAMSVDQRLYHGMPIVLTVNQPALELSNGDRGVVVYAGEQLFVVFKRGEGEYQFYPPGSLLAYESAYAITVHKSQGSEYQKVAIVLPQEAQRLLGPRLLYTAITRAKSSVWLFGEKVELETAVNGAIETRASRIGMMWSDNDE